jgi:anti-sigma factor RsiW
MSEARGRSGGDAPGTSGRISGGRAPGCPQNADLLALQAGGDLQAWQAALLRRHLDGCSDCRQLLSELRATREWVRVNLPAVDADALAELRRRVVGRLARERPFPWLLAILGRAWVSWRNLGWQPVRGPAVAALLVVGALGALPSLNGRLLETGSFSPEPAADARPAVVHAIAAEPDEGEAVESEEGSETEPLLGHDGAFDDDPPSDPSGLRIELQTRDPNVRIIWFAANADRGP